jgi:phosphate transport system substrate-binding protein
MKQKLLLRAALAVAMASACTLGAQSLHQPASNPAKAADVVAKQKVVVVTGVRFTYPLIQKWIDEYGVLNPDVQIIIDARGSSDPAKYDILAEVFEHDDQIKKNREYLYVGRFAVLPVANAAGVFGKTYSEKGLNTALIRQIFFEDPFADKDLEQKVTAEFTVYTRLQKAGAPMVFGRYFGFDQKDIRGRAIAGSDQHLRTAILRDSLAVSYLPLSLIFDGETGYPVKGLTVLPVDLNGNGKISGDEKVYDRLDHVIQRFEEPGAKELQNVPLGYFHLSISRQTPNPDAVAFLQWVLRNGKEDLHQFGYLHAEPAKSERQSFESFLSKHAGH